jgi:hypothetical protein
MKFETRQVILTAALIISTGIAGIELSRDGAEASSVLPALDTAAVADYPQTRVDMAFLVAAEVPPSELDIEGAAESDLPVGCDGPFRPEVQAECLDAASEVADLSETVIDVPAEQASALIDEFELAEF